MQLAVQNGSCGAPGKSLEQKLESNPRRGFSRLQRLGSGYMSCEESFHVFIFMQLFYIFFCCEAPEEEEEEEEEEEPKLPQTFRRRGGEQIIGPKWSDCSSGFSLSLSSSALPSVLSCVSLRETEKEIKRSIEKY